MDWLKLALLIESQIPQLIAAAQALRENHGGPVKSVQEYHDEAQGILAEIKATAEEEINGKPV